MTELRNESQLTECFASIIKGVGEDPDREGIIKTPKRAAKAFLDLTSGYKTDLEKLINSAIFKCNNQEMVVVTNIQFYSLCEHHLLPFFGKAHVAYIPKGKVIGLSKIPRIVDMYARRLQIQEDMTSKIAETLKQVLEPRGVAVVTEAQHMCMEMRGVQKIGSVTKSSEMLGEFRTDAKVRSEFLELIKR